MHSPRRVFLKGVLTIFVKIIGKHLCRTLSFNKVVNSRPVSLLKGCSGTRVFCEFCKNFNTFFVEHLLATVFWRLFSMMFHQIMWDMLLIVIAFYEFCWPKFRRSLLSWTDFVTVSGINYRSSPSREVHRKRFPAKYTHLK